MQACLPPLNPPSRPPLSRRSDPCGCPDDEWAADKTLDYLGALKTVELTQDLTQEGAQCSRATRTLLREVTSATEADSCSLSLMTPCTHCGFPLRLCLPRSRRRCCGAAPTATATFRSADVSILDSLSRAHLRERRLGRCGTRRRDCRGESPRGAPSAMMKEGLRARFTVCLRARWSPCCCKSTTRIVV